MAEHVLLIEDDEHLSAMLSEYLGTRGFTVTARATATDGLKLLRQGGFAALVLDIMLPDLDGFEVCRRVRAESDIPILMLTARGDEMDRIVGLEIGSDDYLPKPFNPRELLTRLRAILRRRGVAGRQGTASLRFGRLGTAREALMDRVRGEEMEAFDRSIDVHISRIRALIEDNPKHPRRIITVRGAGYVFARHQDDDRGV